MAGLALPPLVTSVALPTRIRDSRERDGQYLIPLPLIFSQFPDGRTRPDWRTSTRPVSYHTCHRQKRNWGARYAWRIRSCCVGGMLHPHNWVAHSQPRLIARGNHSDGTLANPISRHVYSITHTFVLPSTASPTALPIAGLDRSRTCSIYIGGGSSYSSPGGSPQRGKSSRLGPIA